MTTRSIPWARLLFVPTRLLHAASWMAICVGLLEFLRRGGSPSALSATAALCAVVLGGMAAWRMRRHRRGEITVVLCRDTLYTESVHIRASSWRGFLSPGSLNGIPARRLLDHAVDVLAIESPRLRAEGVRRIEVLSPMLHGRTTLTQRLERTLQATASCTGWCVVAEARPMGQWEYEKMRWALRSHPLFPRPDKEDHRDPRVTRWNAWRWVTAAGVLMLALDPFIARTRR